VDPSLSVIHFTRPQTKPTMAIYSMCSDLETREIVWVSRQTETAPQDRFAGMINPAPASWYAARHADAYRNDHRG
jgi:hypothetical protein